MKTNFTPGEIAIIEDVFGVESVAPTSLRISLTDGRKNTICYRIYKHPDGYRWRRLVNICPWLPKSSKYGVRFYQLNRNSHTGVWPAFTTLDDAVDYMAKYLNNAIISYNASLL